MSPAPRAVHQLLTYSMRMDGSWCLSDLHFQISEISQPHRLVLMLDILRAKEYFLNI